MQAPNRPSAGTARPLRRHAAAVLALVGVLLVPGAALAQPTGASPPADRSVQGRRHKDPDRRLAPSPEESAAPDRPKRAPDSMVAPRPQGLAVEEDAPPEPRPAGPTPSPEPTPEEPRFPDGRLEIVPMVGWARFGHALTLKNRVMFGGEIAHNFDLDSPHFSLSAFVFTEGALTQLTGTSDDIDVILATAGVSFGYRGLGRFVPAIRGGMGFVIVDGTKSELHIRGRSVFNAGLDLRYYLTDWLVLRAAARFIVHDNVQLGGGSGQRVDVVTWILGGGIGFVR